MFARGLATWAVAAEHNVTIVGFNRGQAEELVKSVHAARAADPRDPLLDNVIFLAMPYNCVLDARDSYGKQLDGKIVVDVTTPIDLDTFEPIHPEAGSAAQEIAKGRPGAKVVKAFHPRFAGTLVAEQNAGQEMRDVFLAGDDVEAKRLVAQLFKEGGLRPIDVGPLRRGRELEAVGYLYVAKRHFMKAGFAARR
jgi:hypothetical protein